MEKNLRRKTDSDKEALFKKIFDLYYQNILNYTARTIGHHQNAEDITQDVFIKIYNNLKNYHEEKKLKAWVFTITRNSIYDYLRKKKVHREMSLEIQNNKNFNPEAQNSKCSPETTLLSQEMVEKYEKIIINLPYKLKETFLLKHEAGLSYKEIAAILQCPVNRLLGRMHVFDTPSLQFKEQTISEFKLVSNILDQNDNLKRIQGLVSELNKTSGEVSFRFEPDQQIQAIQNKIQNLKNEPIF